MTFHFYRQNYRRKIPSVNSFGHSVGKLWTLFIMSITEGITDGKFRRYFSESVIWRFSEKIQLIPSVNPLVIKNIITEGYTDEMKRIIFFFYQRIYRRKKNYRRKIHRRSISVGKLITDGICVLHRRKNSVGKTVKSCSVKEVLLNFFKNN